MIAPTRNDELKIPMTNSTKVWLFIASLSLASLFVGYHFGDRLGLFLGFLFAVTLNLLIFLFGDTQLLKRMKAERLMGQDPWGLNELAAKYSRSVGLPTPDVYLTEHATAAAFSCSHAWSQGSICLSTGLLKKFSSAEIAAVIAYEVCQIRNLDSFVLGVTGNIANSLIGVAQWLDQFWPFSQRHSQKPFVTMLSPLAWIVIYLSVTKRNYYANDDMASGLLPDRQILAEALWKLEGLSSSSPMDVPPCSYHLFIVNPLGLKKKNWFFLFHPKIENRIRRLVGHFPL